MTNNRQTILLIGGNGQVGWELQRTLASLGELVVADQMSPIHPVDLANPDSIQSLMQKVQPKLIVNAAAYTGVDKAEEKTDLAMAINGTAPGILAEEAKSRGAAMVHYSTDYVFDGSATHPYTEADEPSPINAYGRTKLAGDQAIEAVGGAYLILRTSWVYGIRGSNFLLTMLRLASERESLKIVDDQSGSPTWSRMIAECTAQILAKAPLPEKETPVLDYSAYLMERAGVYNISSSGTTTWYGFAKAILENVSRKNEQKTRELLPIPTTEYPVPAPRPAYSVLSGKKLTDRFGLTMPDWHQALTLCMEDLVRSKW